MDADLSGSDVGNHLRNEEGVEFGARVDMLAVVHHLVLEGLDATDADTVDDADAGLVLLLEVEPRVLDTLDGADHGQLRVAVHLAHFLAIQVVSDVEILHLTGKLRLEVCRIKMRNRRSTALSGHEVLPRLLRCVAHGRDGTESCYYYSL